MILITGATGFVGKRLIPILSKKVGSSQITCLVWNSNSRFEINGRALLKKYHIKYQLVDLETNEGMNQLKYLPQTIIHMAANTDTATANHKVNDVGTINLIKFLRKINASTHFVYVSSAAIMAGKPTNEYGRSKYRAEKFLLNLQEDIGFKLTIIRPTTIYGPNPRPDSMFDFIKKGLNRKLPMLSLNWPGKTGFIFVNDVAQAIVNSLNTANQINIYNLASESLSFNHVVSLVSLSMGVKLNQIKLPRFFWTICTSLRPFVYKVEKLFPSSIYNLFWRSTLIVDNVIDYSDIDLKRLDITTPTRLSDYLNQT